jgi:hypothetical protein
VSFTGIWGMGHQPYNFLNTDLGINNRISFTCVFLVDHISIFSLTDPPTNRNLCFEGANPEFYKLLMSSVKPVLYNHQWRVFFNKR